MHLKINIPNDCNLFKANIRALGDSNIFRNRRLNIITAITYYAAIVFIFLMTMALGFYVNPRLYSVFFYGIDMITNILFLVVLGYRCQDYGIHRYIGILCVVIICSIITLYCGGDFFVSPSNYILAVSDTTISLNKPFFFIVMNRIIFLLLLIPGSQKNSYGDRPASGFWDGSYLVMDPLNIKIIKIKIRKLWNNLIGKKDCDDTLRSGNAIKEQKFEFMEVLQKILIKDIFNFEGRSSRDELMIFTMLFSVLSMLLSYINISDILNSNVVNIFIIDVLVAIIILVPYISLLVRRLHDSGNSGLWLFFIVVPIVNVYVLYMLFFKPTYNDETIKC